MEEMYTLIKDACNATGVPDTVYRFLCEQYLDEIDDALGLIVSNCSRDEVIAFIEKYEYTHLTEVVTNMWVFMQQSLLVTHVQESKETLSESLVFTYMCAIASGIPFAALTNASAGVLQGLSDTSSIPEDIAENIHSFINEVLHDYIIVGK